MVRNLSDLLLFVEKHRRETFPLSYLSEPLIAVWVLTHFCLKLDHHFDAPALTKVTRL
jgi:hypothetical protein